MNYKTYCVHHKPLIHRKQYLDEKKQEYGLDFEYIETHQTGSQYFSNGYNITDAELSVTLKILDVLKIVVEQDIDYCFIFEDDIIIEFDLNEFFKKILLESENVDLIFWGGTPDMSVHNPTPNKIVYTGYQTTRAGHGIMYTKETCKKILENYDYSFNRQYDWSLNFLIPSLKLNCGWTYPHVRQKTVERLEPSSIR